jgi:hypothetical protein
LCGIVAKRLSGFSDGYLSFTQLEGFLDVLDLVVCPE